MSWPADQTSFCSAFSPDDSLSTADCGSYRALSTSGVDTGASYYYDKATGKLAAVVSYNAVFQTVRCQGGPRGFVEPSCGSSQPLSCPDAGGGTGGAGAAGGTSGAAGDAGGFFICGNGAHCNPGQLCVEIGAGLSFSCKDNPCGSQPPSCSCAGSLCDGSSFQCTAAAGRKVTCDSP